MRVGAIPTAITKSREPRICPSPGKASILSSAISTLLDIADFRAGLREMARVLKPGGTLLIANLNSFITSCSTGWIKDQDGSRLYYPVDRYLEEFPEWVAWSGIRIENWHRPLASYMRQLLELGLTLTFFDEPQPRSGDDPERHALYRRAPWFLVMEWRLPLTSP